MSKQTVRFLGSMVGILAATVFVLTTFGALGYAVAATSAEPPTDPVDLVDRFLQFITTSRGTVAIGVVNMLFVWILRSVVGPRVRWFATRPGGYILGLGTSVIEYFGSALIVGDVPTLGLAINALGAAFTAAGGWHALRDIVSSTGRSVGPASMAALLAILVVSSPGCTGRQRSTIVAAASDIVDCTVDVDLAAVGRLAPLVLDATRGEWGRVIAAVEPLGPRLGLCLGAEVLRLRPPGEREGSSPAAEPLAALKARFGVAVVRTAGGDL